MVHFATAHAVSTIEVFITHVQRNSPRLILGYSSPKVIYFRLTLRTITQLLYSRNLFPQHKVTLVTNRVILFHTVESAYTYRAAFTSTETPIDKQRHYTGSGRDNN